MIALDTSVLSVAFRRRRGAGSGTPPEVAALRRFLADETPVIMPGIVLQEVLSGMKSAEQKSSLRGSLEGIPVLLAERGDHEEASEIATACASRGVAASSVDCLIAAQCIAAKAELLTLDEDFKRIATCCSLKLCALG